MKLRLLSLCAAVAFVPGALHAAAISAESRISTVTVYGQGALVTRQADVALETGQQEIVFNALPESLDPDLLQVSGAGTAQATILDVTAVTTQLETPANARLKELRGQARTIQEEFRTLNDRAAVLKAQRDYLEQIRQATVASQGAAENPTPLPTVPVWEQYIEFYTEGLSKVLTAIQALDRQKEDTKARLEAIERQIAELAAPESRTVTNVTVRVQVATAGTMSVKLVYSVHAAHWRPTYDVRVVSADKSIQLDYGASVRQSTGEDWAGVALVLSTAQPNRSGTPPELSTWYLQHYVPQPMPTAMPAAAMESRARSLADAEARKQSMREDDTAEMAAFAIASAQVEAGLNSAVFTIPYAADIPADNAAHKVVITSAPLTGELSHLAVPKLAEFAYLRAAVTNTTEFPLIGGEIALFLDGNFVARSMIRTVSPTEKFDLHLGVDDGISVKRKLLNRLREDTGVISRRVRTTYDVLITVQNNRKTPEKLVVKDQVPVSMDEKIVVTLVEPPARDITRDEDGTIHWTLVLKPGEKRDLALKIAVEHPADLQVSGLE